MAEKKERSDKKNLSVKKIPVTRSSMPPFEEYVNEIRDIWDSHWLTNMGIKHQELERELREYLSADKIQLFANGHSALELSLEAMGINGEVITTPFTFSSTTYAIMRSGCTPVFCDIDPVTFTVDPDKLESLITEKTSAILPVHVYGNICHVEEIEEIAKRHHLKVIYDAAHAFGVRYKNRGIGSFGDLSMFSFHATKVFNTIEGGAVCFRDDSLSDRLFQIKNFGIQENDVHSVGANAKMNEFQAAMGLCNLRHVDEEIGKRRLVTERYREKLSGIKGIRLNAIRKEVSSNYAYFPVVFKKEEFGFDREEVIAALNRENIFPRRYFYPCTNAFSCLEGRFHPEETPVAREISESVLTLPLYADLLPADTDRICDIILNMKHTV